jgi:hypothetical protein
MAADEMMIPSMLPGQLDPGDWSVARTLLHHSDGAAGVRFHGHAELLYDPADFGVLALGY